MTFIYELPIEMLQLIFTFHVWRNEGSPYALLTVCREWKEIASATCQVWSNILYIDPRSLHDDSYHKDHGGKIRCTTPQQLAHAIERTGDAKFNLTFVYISALFWDPIPIPPEWKCIDQSAISSRCRSLDLEDVTRAPRFLELFHDMQALEVLKLSGSALAADPEPMTRWLMDVEKMNSPLRECHIPFSSQSYKTAYVKRLLQKIKVLSTFHLPLEAVETPNLLSLVQELIVETIDYKIDLLVDFSVPNLRRLTIFQDSIFLSPLTSSRQLTSLTLRMSPNRVSPAWSLYRIPLLSLRELEVNCCWTILSHLNAPNLYELTFDCNGHELPIFPLLNIEGISMRPKILRVDNGRNPDVLLHLIQWIGTDLEVLYMKDTFDQNILPPHLVQDFTRKYVGRDTKDGMASTTLSLCPRLDTLIILSPEPVRGLQSAQIKEGMERRLAQIVLDPRRKEVLRYVRCGWYPRPMPKPTSFRRMPEYLADASKEWWKIDWKDLV